MVETIGSLSNGKAFTQFFRAMKDGIKVLVTHGWTPELGYYITIDTHSQYRMSRQDYLTRLSDLGWVETL